jgi:putative radical SAM enzyme (TIGR03279 family)
MQPGDCLVSINGRIVRDVIDVQFFSADEDLALRFLREGKQRTLRVSRRYGESLGLDFETPLFDGIRRCQNRCEFCFVGQMPRGLRPSLYIRDDDFRLSFLTGSFVTLTNLSEGDWERIAEQGLSPLYVSVHATEPALRARILGTHDAPDTLCQLERLRDLGVEVHTQVVLVPGLNDGKALDRTVGDLAALYPTVASVSLVPVGLTRFRRNGLRNYTPAEASALLRWAEPVRRRFREEWGIRFVYPSDEWYLLAGVRVPGASAYDGFPQIENGVGLVRQFLSDWFRTKRRLAMESAERLPGRMTWVTGRLFAPVLRDVADWLGEELDITIEVVPVLNRFFGETVTVAGLLTAEDVAAALQGRGLGDVVVLPRAMLDHAGQVTLDDRTPEWIEGQVGRRVMFADGIKGIQAGTSSANL